MSSFLFALLLAALCTCQVAATCYNPDGTEIKDSAYQACNQFLGAFSPCCGTNHTGAVAPDTCQTNGLCQNNGDSVYWRQGCTDKTWKSPFCLHLCTDPQNGGAADDNAPVGQCSDGTWCCGGVNATCCNLKQGISIAATIGVSSTSSSSQSSSTSTSSASSSEISTTTSTPASDAASGTATPSATRFPESTETSSPDAMGTGAKIGIGVGIAGGVLAIAAIVAFFLMRKRLRKAPGTPPIPQYENPEVAYHEVAGFKGWPPMHSVEVQGYKNPVEAPTNVHRAELGS